MFVYFRMFVYSFLCVQVSRGAEECDLSNAFASAAQELGLKAVDYTSKDQIGVSQTLFTMKLGERYSQRFSDVMI